MDNNIKELAEKLGQAIANTSAAADLRRLRGELESQPEITKTLQEFNEHSEKLAQLEAENKPIEVDDKRKLQELHNQLVSSDLFKRYTTAQMEYVDLMRKVSDTIRTQLGEQ
jgi:cell fate (sporulation/competence/biofilm development) regulator YlbF (YheA/YmcA/DUF963 family)